jgi:putative oxidoreductase
MSVGSLAARAVIGGLFIGHGTQKLFGWFGGPGPAGTEQMMTALEMHPAKRNAMAAGVTETVGGALLTAGLATPAAAAALIGVMTTAIRKVHMKNGFWNANGGYEFNLVLIAALLAIVDKGPGKASMDHAMGIDDTGAAWALAALATGVAASTLTIELAHRSGPTTSSGVDQVPVDGEPYTDTAGDPVTAGS